MWGGRWGHMHTVGVWRPWLVSVAPCGADAYTRPYQGLTPLASVWHPSGVGHPEVASGLGIQWLRWGHMHTVGVWRPFGVGHPVLKFIDRIFLSVYKWVL